MIWHEETSAEFQHVMQAGESMQLASDPKLFERTPVHKSVQRSRSGWDFWICVGVLAN